MARCERTKKERWAAQHLPLASPVVGALARLRHRRIGGLSSEQIPGRWVADH